MGKTLVAAASVCAVLALGSLTAEAAGNAAAGQAKASNCAGCHGADGKGQAPNPALAGLKADYFVAQLKAFKSGKRKNALMKMMAGNLSDEDMENLAAYYASLRK